MIKMVTAHPRITRLVVVGAVGTSVMVGGDMLGFSPSDVASHAGSGLSNAYKYIKAAGIASAFIGVMFILFRFNILGWKMAPENSSFMIARRGRIVRHKNGDVVLHDSGRNRLHVFNYRHLVPIHFGDRFVELGRHEFSVNGVTWKTDFTLRWRIPKDKRLLERTVTSVSDRNWWDGEFNQLTRAIKETSAGKLDPLLKKARIDEASGLPEYDRQLASQLFTAALEPYGGKYYELVLAPITPTDAQQNKDGSLAIAAAIASVGADETPADALSLLKRFLKL